MVTRTTNYIVTILWPFGHFGPDSLFLSAISLSPHIHTSSSHLPHSLIHLKLSRPLNSTQALSSLYSLPHSVFSALRTAACPYPLSSLLVCSTHKPFQLPTQDPQLSHHRNPQNIPTIHHNPQTQPPMTHKPSKNPNR